MPDRCVEIQRSDEPIFSIWVFGDQRSVQMFPQIKASPVLQQLGWAPLIRAAYSTNRLLYEPPPAFDSFLSLLPSFRTTPPAALPPSHRPPIPGLLAIHVRRGDFGDHCEHLAKWSSRFNGLNTFPGIPDRFDAPPGGGWGENTPENTQIYMKRCFPSVRQIVEKILEVRKGSRTRDVEAQMRPDSRVVKRFMAGGQELTRLHIMTNAKREWIEELKAQLRAAADWDAIVSSRDLVLTKEQKYVAQAVDMYIGERAQEFIGNGFSSLTSNIVVLRLAHDYPPNTIHFW
ncbi:hypothetical protein HGRIS_004117 [Hohenbuehelia grisea]|uniref:Uncharacterized protein n=1 Tax=Hohenbuehelia grisea TaxID=104357 RepID=A0ABR3JHI2_9AGAR